MQKCTLSRIKSYEEKHFIQPKKYLCLKNQQVKSTTLEPNDDYINNKNNQADSTNFKELTKINNKNSSLSNLVNRIDSTPNIFPKRNYKSSNNISLKKKIINNKPESSTNNSLIQKQKIRIIHSRFQKTKKIQRNYLLTNDLFTGEINFTQNGEIKKFKSDKKGNNIDGHLTSLTNIFCFQKLILKNSSKDNKIIKKTSSNMIIDQKISTDDIQDHKKLSDYNSIKTQKHYSTNNSKIQDLQFKKLNFDQPNKVISQKLNNKKRNVIKKEMTNLPSYTNQNETNSLKKKMNRTTKKKISDTHCFCNLRKYNKDYSIIANNINKNFDCIQKTKTEVSTPDNNKRNTNIFRHSEKQTKMKYFFNKKNNPDLFINNNDIKRVTTRYYHHKRIKGTYIENNNTLESQKKPDIQSLNMKQILKKKVNSNIKKENNNKNISNKTNSNKVKFKNNKNKNNISDNSLNNGFVIKNIKKNSTKINTSAQFSNFQRMNINKKINSKNFSGVMRQIPSKDYKSNISHINSLKNKSQIINSAIINYSSTYTNVNKIFKIYSKYDNNENVSQSDTDKEENSPKKSNKNFNNAKKILNKFIKCKENEKNNDANLSKKILTNEFNKKSSNDKNLRKTNRINLFYKVFIGYNIEKFLDKNSLINFSWINRRIYKKDRILIFQYYYYKIIRDKHSKKYRLYLLKNIFAYSSKELKNKNEIGKKYDYYSKKMKSKYKEDILKDIPRTFPNDITFEKELKNKLYNLLICYSNFNKEIGYAQGLNFLAASGLYFFPKEEDAFVFLDSFINRFELYNNFGIDNKNLIQKMQYFETLIIKYIPELNKFFISKSLNHEFFSARWIISIFSNSMNKNELIICWCFMIIFGWKFFYSFSIQVLIKYKEIIINCKETKLCFEMKNILNNSRFIKDFNSIIKNTFNFMSSNILL